MKIIALINLETMEVEENGFLCVTANEVTFANLNLGFKHQGINKIWLIEPDNGSELDNYKK